MLNSFSSKKTKKKKLKNYWLAVTGKASTLHICIPHATQSITETLWVDLEKHLGIGLYYPAKPCFESTSITQSWYPGIEEASAGSWDYLCFTPLWWMPWHLLTSFPVSKMARATNELSPTLSWTCVFSGWKHLSSKLFFLGGRGARCCFWFAFPGVINVPEWIWPIWCYCCD